MTDKHRDDEKRPLTEGKVQAGGRGDPPTSERPDIRPQQEPLPKVKRPAPWPEPNEHIPPTDKELAALEQQLEYTKGRAIEPGEVPRCVANGRERNYSTLLYTSMPRLIAEVRRLRDENRDLYGVLERANICSECERSTDGTGPDNCQCGRYEMGC